MLHNSLSVINALFSLDIAELAQKINDELPNGSLLHHDNEFIPLPKQVLSLLKLKHKIEVFKHADISLSVRENKIYALVPLKIKVLFAGSENLPLGKLQHFSSDAQINLTLLLNPYITANWELGVKSAIQKYKWGSEFTIRTLGISLEMGWLVNRTTLQLLPLLLPTFDEKLTTHIHIRQDLEDAWTAVQKPYLLSDHFPLWLQVSPQHITVSPLHIGKESIALYAQAEVYLKSYIGDSHSSIKSPLLPDVAQKNIDNDHWQIHLPIEFSYEQLTEWASQAWVGKPKTIFGGLYKVTFQSVQFSYDNNRVALKADVSGDINGRLLMSGIPFYSEKQQLIYLRDLDLKIEAKESRLVSFAQWLLPETLRRVVQSRLNFDVAEGLSKLQTHLNQVLTNHELSDDLCLNGAVEHLKLEELHFNEQLLRLNMTGSGTANITVSLQPATQPIIIS